MTDLDNIETDPLSINAIINGSFVNSNAMHNGKGQLYSDEEVTQLPSIRHDHPHYLEWKFREHSTKRLLKLVQHAGTSPNILQVGCGIGWLAAKLASVTQGQVVGIDTNMRELMQAKRVFRGLRNLDFSASDISDGPLKDKQFDLIVFAAYIQFLPSLKAAIKNAIGHLTLMGQIHILDSPMNIGENIWSKQTNDNDQQVHHISELECFQYKIIYDPDAWNNKLFTKRDPYCHIVIKNYYH